jgi:hypothetical protein
MNETIDIPITYKGNELIFKARVIKYGYIHRFEVNIEGSPVIFEPDEERNYRALLDPAQGNKSNSINLEFLKLIAETIESLS